MKSKILLLILLISSLFADNINDNIAATLKNNSIDQTTLKSIETKINSSISEALPDGEKVAVETGMHYFISKDNPDSTKCEVKCPLVKNDYFTRIADFNYETGVTQCYVYAKDDPTVNIAVISQANQFCIKDITPNIKYVNIDKYDYSSSMDSIASKYKNYINTGSQEFLNLPAYMIAGLTVDKSKIDVPTTIINNEVTLKSDYTIYPNATTNPTTDSYLDQLYNEDLVSTIKLALDNSVVFIMNFLDRANPTFISLKVTLFFLLVPISVVLAAQSKLTKYMSGVNDYDDVAERVLFGFISFFIFYMSTTQVKTNEDRYISQNVFQNTTRPFFYKVSEKADDLTTSATYALLSYKFKQVGLNTKDDIKNIQNQIFIKSKKQLADLVIMKDCSETYNTANLRLYGKQIGVNQTYPPTETIKTYDKFSGKDEKINYYTTGINGFLKNPSYLTKSDTPSVSFCYKAQRDYMQNKVALKSLNDKQTLYENAMSNKTLNKQVVTLTDLIFRNNAELGWVGISTLATTTLAFDRLGVINVPDNKEEKEKVLKDFRDSSGYEVGKLVKGDGMLNKIYHQIISSLPYFFLPGASSIQSILKEFFSLGEDVFKNVLESIPFVGNFLSSIAGTAMSSLGLILSVTATAYLMAQFISILPVVAIIAASFMAIGFYYLTLEIFYIAVPFVSVFAFSTGNLEILKLVFKNFFVLALKPILIVMSVVLAVFVIGFFNSFHEMLVNGMFEPINMLLNSVDQNGFKENFASFSNDTYIIFFKGLIHIASSVIAVLTAFYLVFNGANMILDMFGLREIGMDIGSTIGEKVENNPTSKKMSTGL